MAAVSLPELTPIAHNFGQRGDAHRFVALFERLSGGQPITILALGSSVTGVDGGCTEAAPIVNRSGLCRCPSCCGVRCGVWGNMGWARSFLERIKERWPHPLHRLVNLGEPGGSLIPTLRTCPHTYLEGVVPHLVLVDPLTTDHAEVERLLLLLLQMTNDAPPSSTRAVHDALNDARAAAASGSNVREFVGLPSTPLPLLVGFLPFLLRGQCVHRCSKASGCTRQLRTGSLSVGGMMGVTERDTRNGTHSLTQLAIERLGNGHSPSNEATLQFYRRGLRQEATWRHYGLPSVQIFDALAHPFEARSSPGVDLCSYGEDGLHPNGRAAARLVSDLIFQRLEEGLHRARHLTRRRRRRRLSELGTRRPEQRTPRPPRRRLPVPLWLPACEERTGVACYTFDRPGFSLAQSAQKSPYGIRGGQLIAAMGGGRSRVTSKELLDSYVASLDGGSGSRLHDAEEITVFKTGVLPPILTRRGWEFVDLEPFSRTPFKPGLVATVPDSTLLLVLPELSSGSSRGAEPSRYAPPPSSVLLVVQYLRSDAGMGVARLRCGGACKCPETDLDAHASATRASMLTLGEVVLTLPGKPNQGRLEPRGRQEPRALPAEGGQHLPQSQCTLEVKLLNRTSSGGHKFRLARLLIQNQRESSCSDSKFMGQRA